ncbi:MAG: pyridoxamine 5'-phosphate oxidase [Gammaproteobacteria bacterium]|nr:pyridoxamine 5'-phosphate oxidase [Gammaproteobacteria bacterium]|tara:strand:+ start:3403 stop:3945 length:543 start_codon:yes stop_codon:yes gene_type:complete
MAEKFDALNEHHIDFIQQQHMFFVGTAAAEGTVNLSPKGMDSLRVIDGSTVAWLNLTGSGNETAAHLLRNNRMTLMFCSFEKQPLILRIYGAAEAVHPRDEKWEKYQQSFPDFVGTRQFYEIRIDLVQTACGYAVPFYEFKGERSTLTKWADKKGRSGVEDYWRESNQISLDGYETDILD